MGGEGFLAKLKALIMGKGEETGEVRPDNEMGEGKPWEDPSLAGPAMPPRMPMAPSGAMPSPSPSPSPSPDPIAAQIQQLMKQRQVMKMLSPEQTWNK